MTQEMKTVQDKITTELRKVKAAQGEIKLTQEENITASQERQGEIKNEIIMAVKEQVKTEIHGLKKELARWKKNLQ